MIKTSSIYLIVKDFEKSLAFYKSLFEKDVDAQNMDRFAMFFINGFCLAINNTYFDERNPDKVEIKGKYDKEYDNLIGIAQSDNSGKVVINLETDDLAKEHSRLLKGKVGENITSIKYVNAGTPYYYFSLKAPDGNTIEITGLYDGEVEE